VKSGMNESKANALLGAHQLYIETFLDTITKQYGSMDLFLEQELGLDQLKRAKLQKRFLE